MSDDPASDAAMPDPGAGPANDDAALEAATSSPGVLPAPSRGRRFLHALGRMRSRLVPRSRRGVLVGLFLVAGFGAVAAVGGVVAVQWTETPDFCGRCHTMGPEMKAYAISPHREVSCTECHVEPGVEGWIKAKLNGTRQLIEVIAGSFPRPIPPPGQGDTRPTNATCQRCHDVKPLVAGGGPVKLVLRARYAQDEANTRDSVALVVRPAGFGTSTATRGPHWHVLSDVEYSSTDPEAQTIDLVQVTEADGSVSQYIAMGQVGAATDVKPDIDRIRATETTVRMDCVTCHNRVGHGVPTVDQEVDSALEQGLIDPTLPYVKQQAVADLSKDYDSSAAAEAAIGRLKDFYAARYPLVARNQASSVDAAVTHLWAIYQLVATPDMKVNAATYANNLGHTTYPGCFRCHDGGHYKVVNGVLTGEAIPSNCATCHTFPQIGPNTSAILIGQRPQTHLDKLWVFNHKGSVASLDPSSTSCAACHTKTYCENCHATQAVRVPHDEMVFNHVAVIRQVGVGACAFCHQQSYCAQCHADQVLPSATGPPPSGTSLLPDATAPPDGVTEFPLVTDAPP